MQIEARPFTVVGAGRSGTAAANLLARRGGDVVLVESREGADRPDHLDSRVIFRPGTNEVRPGDTAVLSPGIPEVSPLRAQIAAVATEVIGEVELFARLCPAPMVAITGTDGKSTTTTMIGAILEEAGRHTFVGGNLGNPLCDDLDTLTSDSWVVAEVSAFQLTTCDRFRPRVAVVTNIAEDHLDYHGGFRPYQAAKRRIWAAMEDGDVLILNGDDREIAAWELPSGPTIRWFSTKRQSGMDAWFEGGRLWMGSSEGPSPLMDRDELLLLGEHNVANALASALACQAAGLSPEVTRRALGLYRPLPHRLETVEVIDEVRWVNDSKATNPNAAAAGLKAIDGPVILLAGGSSKDADFSGFAALVKERARATILFGSTRETLKQAIGPGPGVSVVETLPEAVELARGIAVPGDTVLLGPACASFDQFRSYGHRGEVFCGLVRDLGASPVD
ncbi:MAG: UDP-N-acetylmuramoyl-L-alanine--D-glutamate ligase [Myxococcota bacterium]|nr:UDP-N-acetylmuramoyl-L-alanine--D-glutamate ligase [Myxococcota bacterium]